MERREARAREELDGLLDALRAAQERAEAGRERLEHARIAREELLLALAEEAEGHSGSPGPVADLVGVPGEADVPAAGETQTPAAVRVAAGRGGCGPPPPGVGEGGGEEAAARPYRGR